MTTFSEKKSANAVGGKTARACDSCLRRRARWYCAADDAFLCQNCDTIVHSANPLARRHERVRLKTSSSSSSPIQSFKQTETSELAIPSWHKGFKRKARTPRSRYSAMAVAPKSEPLVPDFEATSETAEEEEEEEQLLYRVPIFDPVLSEFCSSHGSDDSAATSSEGKPVTALYGSSAGLANALPGFDVDMGEFSADVESLLGRVLDEDAFSMEGLGLMEASGEVNDCCFVGGGYVKLETSDGDENNGELLDLNFECGSPSKASISAPKRRRISLRLDYEGVISAWSSSQGCSSPWADGERPLVNPDECLPDFIGLWGEVPSMGYGGGEMSGGGEGGQSGGGSSHGGGGDGGREARVSRYREKRRTRLFSKKIRYEVRKLNAEKRPRMKGRFVKSASFGGAAGAPAGIAVQPAFAF